MSNFHELINRNTPTLVDFYADWCGPCKLMPPILNEVKSNLGGAVNIIKVDVDKNNKAAHKYGIRSIPTLILFKNGKILWRKTGVAQVAEIQQAVRKIA
ncbi:thioredoxin [Marinoscillum sp. 108]|uniref:Thioredoxin n=1 Tax=Marinoscillum luteum TaxID=861051 RepID=A0ABW7N8A5_9BACT|nr:thioredoxin [Marinoscillum sp. 108]VXD10915.1 Thioredoxin [Marinoscillum sp. 108]